MRNKKRLRYAAALGLAVPFMVFSMVFAEHSEDESATEAELHKLEEKDRLYKERVVEQEKQAIKAREAQKLQEAEKIRDAQKVRLEEAKLKGQEVREGVKERVGERVDKAGEGMEKTRENRVKAIGIVMQAQLRRAENVISRIQQIIDRLESRRAKLVESGADLDDVDAAISKAKSLLSDAQGSLATAKDKYAALEGSSEPKVAVQTFITAMRELKTDLMALHGSLKGVVTAMRASLPKPELNERAGEQPEESTN